MGSVKLRGGDMGWGTIGLNGRNKGEVGDIASVSFRWLPRTSVGVCGVFGEGGSSKPVNYEGWLGEIGLNGRKLGAVGDIATVCFCQILRASLGIRDIWAEEGRWKMEIMSTSVENGLNDGNMGGVG